LPIEIDCNKVNDENEEYDYGDI